MGTAKAVAEVRGLHPVGGVGGTSSGHSGTQHPLWGQRLLPLAGDALRWRASPWIWMGSMPRPGGGVRRSRTGAGTAGAYRKDRLAMERRAMSLYRAGARPGPRGAVAALPAATLAPRVRRPVAGGARMSTRIGTVCAQRSLTAVARDYATLADEAANHRQARRTGRYGPDVVPVVPGLGRNLRRQCGAEPPCSTACDTLPARSRSAATAAASLLRSNSGGKRVLRLPRPETNRFRCEAPLCVCCAHALRRGSAAVETAVRLDGCIRWPSATWLRPQALTGSRHGQRRALD